MAAVPSDFKALKHAYFDGSPVTPLWWTSIDKLYQDYPNRNGSGVPCVISREAGNFVFGPNSKDGDLKGVYYAKQVPLRTTSVNWYVTNAPEVLLYGALIEAEPFIKNDPRLPVWNTLFVEAVRTLKDEERASSVAMGGLTQRPA